jgi:hypothetical protein
MTPSDRPVPYIDAISLNRPPRARRTVLLMEFAHCGRHGPQARGPLAREGPDFEGATGQTRFRER